MTETWEAVTLDDVSEDITVGHVGPMADQYVDIGVPFLRSLNVEPFRINTTDLKQISREFHKRLKKSALKPDDIVIVRTGKPGSCALIPSWLGEANCSDVVVVRTGPKVRPAYVSYVVNSTAAHHIDAHTVGAVQQHFNVASARQIRFRLPPIHEQDRILSVLGTLDDKIELNRRMNETLEAMARAIFKDWFIDFGPTRAKMEGRVPYLAPDIWSLFPDRQDDEGKPEGWERRSIYEIADVIYGAPFASAQFNSEKQGEPLLRIRDLVNELPGVWTPEAHPKGYKVKPGDIVVGMDGEFRAYLWGGAEAWLNQRVCVFAPKRSFSSAFVRNSIIGPLADVEATEIATTVIHLGKNDIDRFSTLLPSKPIMMGFNDLVQPLYDRIVQNKVEARTLATTRDLLLPKLMSGEIRVMDAEKLVEEVA
jgi:type I restriction enzyme, S subunit